MQGRDVAEPGKQLACGGHRVQVQQRQQPGAPTSAARAKDGGDPGVGERLVQVRGTVGVRPGEVAVAGIDVPSERHPVAGGFQESDPGRGLLGADR
jgi:hypothetical protein